jgi:GDP-fucose transporter C1
MAPVTATNIIGLAFNIYCLKLVDASYFLVARGLTLPMTVVLQSITFGEKPTIGTIASCGLVTWGFTYSFIPSPFGQSTSGLASTEAPMLGMVLGVAAAAMVAIHAILIKQALKTLDGRTLDLAYWQNAISALSLIPAILMSGEVGGIMRMITGEEGSLSAFLIGSGLTVSLPLLYP